MPSPSTTRIRLTDSFIRELAARDKVFAVKDSEVKNLQVIVQVSGSKAFYVQHGQKKRKIADCSAVSVSEARRQVYELLSVGLDSAKCKGKSLKSAIDEYMSSRRFSRGFESNVKQAKRVFARVLDKAIESIEIGELVRLVDRADKVNGEPLADSTKDSSLNILSSVYSYQMKLEAIDFNPVSAVRARIQKLKVNKRTFRLDSYEHFAAFVDWVSKSLHGESGVSHKNAEDAEHTKLLVIFLLLTGCRVGEAINLKKEDVWFNAERLRNPDGTARFMTLTFKNTKNGSDLTIQLTPVIYQVVTNAINNYTSGNNSYVFRCEARGKAVSFDAMYARVHNLLSNLEIEGVQLHPHDLRRTFAYMATKAGLTREEVGILLNHSSASMTERYQGELSALTHSLLSKYHRYLGNHLTQTQGEYQAKGLGLLSGDARDIEYTLLSEIQTNNAYQDMNFDDYYGIS